MKEKLSSHSSTQTLKLRIIYNPIVSCSYCPERLLLSPAFPLERIDAHPLAAAHHTGHSPAAHRLGDLLGNSMQ